MLNLQVLDHLNGLTHGIMEIIASVAHNMLSSTFTLFSLGTAIGASSVYLFLRKGKNGLPNIPVEEDNFELPDRKDEFRLVMAIRNDLRMQKGKVAAQCGHAAIAAYTKALKHKPKTLGRWMEHGGTKITVKIESEQELIELDKAAKQNDVLSSIIRDAGQTQVAPGTRTVLALGPAPNSILNKITGHLKLY